MQTTTKAQTTLEKERFMLQSAVIIKDVLGMLQSSPQIKQILDDNSSASLYAFLSSASLLPFESAGYRVLVSLSSARDRYDINNLNEGNTTQKEQKAARLETFFAQKGISRDLVDYLLDALGGVQSERGYRSDMFFQNPSLVRGRIVSGNQLETILLYYTKRHHVDIERKIDFEALFSFERNRKTKIDLNYATPLVWEMITGVSQEQAEALHQNGGAYEKVEDLGLDRIQKERLELFPYSFFEPVVRVRIDVQKDTLEGSIEFEYDLKTQKASDFVYTI